MKVTYNASKNAYQVIYKDKLAELAGKPIYARKQFSAGKSKPTAAERKTRIKELELWASEQEKNSETAAMAKLNDKPNLNGEKYILAVEYLENLKGDDLTGSKIKKCREDAKFCLAGFISFLKIHYPEIHLHKINKQIAKEWANEMTKQKRTFAYIKKRWLRMGYIFNMVCIKFEDSELKYRNPFYSLKITKVAVEEPVNHRKVFSAELVRLILEEALLFNKTKTREQSKAHKFQRWAMLYLLALTGIRPKDIITLKWEQVNFQSRTIRFTHSKTKRKGISTAIYMTPHLMELFYDLKKLHETDKPLSKDYIFSFHCLGSAEKSMEEFLYIANLASLVKFFVYFREKHGLMDKVELNGKNIYLYSTYSLRATVGTVLTWANFNQNSIDYLQGHAPSNTTARFYLNHEANPKAATADMLNFLAFNFIQQPLGEVGLKYAYEDNLIEQKEMRRQKEIQEEIRYSKDGTSLLTYHLLQKIDEENKQRAELIKQHGEEMADFLSNH